MTYSKAYGAAHHYLQVGNEAVVTDADPHRLIQLLLDGALARISAAKGHIQRGEVGPKGECISKAIAIVDGLRASLDYDKGAEIAGNLGALYGYMERVLLEANLRNDLAKLDEVAGLLGEIRDAWAAIAPSGSQAAP